LKSSGYANVDGPVLNTLHKWTAEGEMFKRVTDTLTVPVHLRFIRD